MRDVVRSWSGEGRGRGARVGRGAVGFFRGEGAGMGVQSRNGQCQGGNGVARNGGKFGDDDVLRRWVDRGYW